MVSQQVMSPRPGSNLSVLLVRGSDAHASQDAAGHGRDWLAQQLQSVGTQVAFVVAYQRLTPPWSDSDRDQAMQAASDGAVWLFSSSQALQQLQRARGPVGRGLRAWWGRRPLGWRASPWRVVCWRSSWAAGWGAFEDGRPGLQSESGS